MGYKVLKHESHQSYGIMTTDQKSRTFYLINSYSSGGAERGILSLLNMGFFDDTELHLFAIHKGTGLLYDELKTHPKVKSISYCSKTDNLTPLAMIKCFFTLFCKIITLRPKRLILSLVQSNLIGYTLAVLFPRLIVTTFLHNTRFSKKIYKKLLSLFAWRVDVFFYDTLETATVMKKFYGERKKQKWYYIPLVSIDSPKTKSHYGLSEPCEIMSVGRLEGQKNYEEAIKAIALLKKKNIAVHYSIAGIGGLEDDLRETINTLDLHDNVTLLGYVGAWHERVLSCDIYLMASAYEGLSIVTIEAMGLGMPIVATDVGGVTEYGQDDINMIKADSPKAEAIASALEYLIADKALRQKIARNAIKTSKELFSQEVVASQLDWVREEYF